MNIECLGSHQSCTDCSVQEIPESIASKMWGRGGERSRLHCECDYQKCFTERDLHRSRILFWQTSAIQSSNGNAFTSTRSQIRGHTAMCDVRIGDDTFGKWIEGQENSRRNSRDRANHLQQVAEKCFVQLQTICSTVCRIDHQFGVDGATETTLRRNQFVFDQSNKRPCHRLALLFSKWRLIRFEN